VLSLAIVTGLIAVVFAQLLYPAGTALPLARIGESSVGGQTFQEVAETIRQGYANVPLKIAVQNKKPFDTTTASAGVVPGYRHAAEAVTDYSLEARLVPFSFVYKMLKTPPVGYELDQDNFNSFYEKFAEYCAVIPKDASLVFADGTVKIDRAKNGQSCKKADLQKTITSMSLSKSTVSVTAPISVTAPVRTDKDLQTQFANAKATVEAGLTIRSTKDSWTIPPETVASWMTTVDASGYTALDVKMDAIKAYLETLRGAVYTAPGVTTVTYHDGVEQKRVVGAKGQGIDLDVSADRVKAVLLGPSTAQRIAWVQLTALEPRVVNEWTYSASEKGLQALIEQWERSHPARYGLMVRDLSGKGMNAEYNGDRDFITASTFKMFLAYAVLHKVEAGELSMDSQTDMGLSARACIEEMILHSTNACALSLFNLAGWDYVHNFIKGQFPSTSLKNSANSDNEKHTTVRDETSFFIKLNAGQLMNGDNTNYLLGLFKRQVYRSGIPKGVPGIVVANKVGFYNGYKHDVGLVYAPRGTYVLGFLSLGGNDSQIADLSRQVYELLSR
jgi:beta-lactamase class A